MNKSNHFNNSTPKQINNCLICDNSFSFFRKFQLFFLDSNIIACKKCFASHIFDINQNTLNAVHYRANSNALIFISILDNDISIELKHNQTLIYLPFFYINKFPIKNIDKFIDIIKLLK